MRDVDEVKPWIMQRMEATVQSILVDGPLPADGYEQLADVICTASGAVFGIEDPDEWLAFMAGVVSSVEMMALMQDITLAVARKYGNTEAVRATMVLGQSYVEALNACLELGLRKMEDQDEL